jgi:hypothetical protein
MPQWIRQALIERLVKLVATPATQRLPGRFRLLNCGTPN